jgi:hypothetical protein
MVEVDAVTTSMEKQLRLLNILGSKDDGILSPTLDSATLKGINLEDNIPLKKVCSSSKGSFGFFFSSSKLCSCFPSCIFFISNSS